MTTKNIIRNVKQPLETITAEELKQKAKEHENKPARSEASRHTKNKLESLNKQEFMYVPNLDIYVSIVPLVRGGFDETTKELHSQNLRMTTPIEFVEFLKQAKSSSFSPYNDLYTQITSEQPHKTIWLDAQFTKYDMPGRVFEMKYHKTGKTRIIEVNDFLPLNTLMVSRNISLDDYLKKHNDFGMPLEKISETDTTDAFKYLPPSNRSCAAIHTPSVRYINMSAKPDNDAYTNPVAYAVAAPHQLNTKK